MNSRIIFVVVAVILVFGIALFTAKIYATSLKVSHPINRSLMVTALIIPLLFIGSMIGSRTLSWGIGPTLYTAINAISGVFLYLFIGAVLLGIIIIGATLAGKTLPLWVPLGICAASLLLGIVGLIQAKFITTTSYTVTLPTAPASWDGKRAVLVADTHFGLVNHVWFSDKVVSRILDIRPDLVLHAGDFYDGPLVPTAPITASWQKLARTIPVFYTPGNHEMYGDYTAFVSSVAASGAHVLDDKVMEYDGVQIAGITYRDGKDSAEATASIEALALDPSRANILINHPPTSLAAAEQKGIDLMVSGHTHNGQFWPMTYLIKRIYGIYAYGYNHFQNMQTITTSGVGTFGPPLRLFNTPELVIITFKTGQ